MKRFPALLALAGLAAAPAPLLADGSCTTCTTPGTCPPTSPFGSGSFEDHFCEDLSDQVVNGAFLENANLASTDLSNVVFLNSFLEGAIFDDALMAGTDLAGAPLRYSTLLDVTATGANFSNAELRFSDLTGGDFTGADFTGADLFDSILDGAVFLGADLSGVNLDDTTGSAFFDCGTDFGGAPPPNHWIQFGFAAAQTSRLGTPPNPDALTAPFAPEVGQTWTPRIDHTTFVPDAVLDVFLVALVPANVDLGSAGTLLCDLSTKPSLIRKGPAPGVPLSVSLPVDCSLLGLDLCLQGGSLDANLDLHLTNALDVTIGGS